MNHKISNRIYFLLLLLSGMSSLLYQLTWQRQLHLLFGSTTHSVMSVLASFMSGLAIGGWLFGRYAEKIKKPLQLYFYLEITLGLFSLFILPFFYRNFPFIYEILHVFFLEKQWATSTLQFSLSFLWLILPCTLIGGTLPLMTCFFKRFNRSPLQHFSSIYGINTLGGLLGILFAGFWSLENLGLEKTLWIGAGINFVSASLSFLLLMNQQENEISLPNPEKNTTYHLHTTMLCSFGSGVVAAGFEVVATRLLAIHTTNGIYTFPLILSLMLIGISLGSFLNLKLSFSPFQKLKRFAFCQFLLAAVLLISTFLLPVKALWMLDSAYYYDFIQDILLSMAMIFFPALILGLGFPLLMEEVTSQTTLLENRQKMGRLFFYNSIGFVVGACFTGLLFIPWLGSHASMALLSSICLLIGLFIWNKKLIPVGLFLFVIIPIVSFYSEQKILKHSLVKYFEEGSNAAVTVTKQSDTEERILWVDSHAVAATWPSGTLDSKSLAHLPLLIHPNPKHALTVGFGGGTTSQSMSLHQIKVDCVEIEQKVVDAVSNFKPSNLEIFQYPLFKLIIDDVRNWLRVSPNLYDVIVTDSTDIFYKSNADLYSVDYFNLIKKRLTYNGIAAAWVQFIRPNDMKILIRSFLNVFPHASVWYMNQQNMDSVILIGTQDRLSIDFKNLSKRMNQNKIKEDLKMVGIHSPWSLVHSLVMTEAPLKTYVGEGKLNTDDRALLAYHTYRMGHLERQWQIPENLSVLYQQKMDALNFITNIENAEGSIPHSKASLERMRGQIGFYIKARSSDPPK